MRSRSAWILIGLAPWIRIRIEANANPQHCLKPSKKCSQNFLFAILRKNLPWTKIWCWLLSQIFRNLKEIKKGEKKSYFFIYKFCDLPLPRPATALWPAGDHPLLPLRRRVSPPWGRRPGGGEAARAGAEPPPSWGGRAWRDSAACLLRSRSVGEHPRYHCCCLILNNGEN